MDTDLNKLIQLYRDITGDERSDDYYESLFKFEGVKESLFYKFFDDGYYTFSKYHLEDDPKKFRGEIVLKNYSKIDFVMDDLLRELSKSSCREILFFTDSKTDLLKSNLTERGASIILSQVESHFLLQEFPISESHLPEGFEIKSFCELKKTLGEDVFDFMLKIVKKAMYDIPGMRESANSLSLEKLKSAWSSSQFFEEGSLVVIHQNNPVAIHNIARIGSDKVTAGVTGVDRDYRRKGLMRALKLFGMKLMKEKGKTHFISSNEKDNPMLSLNYDLGFKKIDESFTVSLRL